MTIRSEAQGLRPGTLLRLFPPLAAFSLRLRRRKALRALENLDNHLLKDIGITRFDVREMRRLW
jgi:uncharacterized protein YjiS (DUF1127 family)